MPSIVQAINDFKFTATKEDIWQYVLEREAIRGGKKTEDYILKNSKFLNIYREHDKVSIVINDLAKDIKKTDNALYAYVYIARLVNHHEHLPWLFKDGFSWLRNPESMQEKMIEFIALGKTVCNPGAYQINPRIGFKYDHRNIRDAMTYVVPSRLPHVVKAFASTNIISEAADKANEAFGGFTNFWMFQAALDIAWLRPDLMDRNSTCYYGSGSKNAIIDHSEMLEFANKNRLDGWREFYPFDIENMMCEYRKYRMRQAKGIPNNRKYKNEISI